MIAKMPIGQYMQGFPGQRDGLWISQNSFLSARCLNSVFRQLSASGVKQVGKSEANKLQRTPNSARFFAHAFGIVAQTHGSPPARILE
jgi:hypothetical protein